MLNAVAELAQVLHRDRIDFLCTKLAGDTLPTWPVWKSCLPAKSHAEDKLKAVHEAALHASVDNEFVKGMLLGASCSAAHANRQQQVELVWTGPGSYAVPTRRTEQVLIELISSASQSLFLTSFVAYRVDSLIAPIKERIAAGVKVSILLERSQESGGALDFDSLSLLRSQLSGAQFYSWSPHEVEFEGGVVHAKVAVCDKKKAFITSANLTDRAMNQNMEAGFFVTGGEVPVQLEEHLDALVATGILSRES
jgi:phosphatidylserine/phosphatidylglycerophosphate/cardiolipin synthase-like enzyme